MIRWFGIGLLILGAASSGCTTHRVGLGYTAADLPPGLRDVPGMRVGPFRDERGVDADWLGAIRGGYGNTLKKLRTEQPVRLVVEDAFREALRKRSLLAPDSSAVFELRGAIRKLDCSYFFNREAHAHLEISLVRLAGGGQVFTNSYRADNTERGIGAGIFGSVETLRALAERTLTDAIDQVMSDPHFLNALKVRPVVGSPAPDLGSRLRELEGLRAQELLTDEEYRQKRSELLDAL